MKYVIIEERLMEPSKLEYYIANINREWWVLYKARRPTDCIQSHIMINMSINPHEALTLFHT